MRRRNERVCQGVTGMGGPSRIINNFDEFNMDGHMAMQAKCILEQEEQLIWLKMGIDGSGNEFVKIFRYWSKYKEATKKITKEELGVQEWN